jgi:hypothetical protein
MGGRSELSARWVYPSILPTGARVNGEGGGHTEVLLSYEPHAHECSELSPLIGQLFRPRVKDVTQPVAEEVHA